MQPRVVMLAVGIAVLALAAWQLERWVDDEAESPAESAIVEAPHTRATDARRTSVPSTVTTFATIRGFVRDESGTPIAGARVCVSDDRCTSTANTGAYVLLEIPTTTLRIAAAASRFQPRVEILRELRDGESRTIDLALASGGSRIYGRIVDLRGNPIANASIVEAATEGVASTSGADGRFEVWVASAPVQLFARATGFAFRLEHVVPPAEIELALVPESTISGMVIDANDAPVAGAQVALGEDGRSPRQRFVTGADGTFRLVGLPARSYEVNVRGFGFSGDTSVTVGVGEKLANVTIRAVDAFQVGLYIKRLDGSPCADGSASLLDPTRRTASVGMSHNQPGKTVIDAVPPGLYEVSVECPPVFSTETIEVRGDIDRSFTVPDPPPIGTLRVTIEAPGRIPGEGDGFLLSLRSPAHGSRIMTVPANRIVVEPLLPGRYSLRLSSTSIEGEETTVAIRSGETTEAVLRIAPPTMGRLRAIAVDVDGRTLTDVPLRITGPNLERSARTLGDGSVTQLLPGGDYAISHASTSVRARVENGASHDVRVTVTPRAVIRGVVVDSAGRPVPDAVVARVNPQMFSEQTRVDTRAVDASGAFQFPIVSNAPMLLVASRVGGGESPLVQTDGTAPVRLVIGAGATLTGSVLFADGTRAPRFSASIADATRNVHLGERSFINGELTWGSLDAGDYRVSAVSNDLVARGTFTVASGARTATITLSLPKVTRVVGRVIDAVSREPLANAKVSLHHEVDDTITGSRMGRMQIWRTTDNRGRFSFDNLIAAAYQLDIAGDARHLATSQLVPVDDAETAVDLGDITVARARN